MAGYPVQRRAGASTAMLMARSGHPSTCSLARTAGLTGPCY
jgi:CBS-domain-containing membrane protein